MLSKTYTAAGFICLAVASMSQSSFAQSSTYSFKTYKAPMMGSTIFEGVNRRSAVLSQVATSGSTTCKLLFQQTTTVISDPKGTATYCYGVDSVNNVVGFYLLPSGAGVGFIYDYASGTYSDYTVAVASPSQGGTQLNAISPSGAMAGAYAANNGFYHAFVTKGSAFHRISISGANYLIPTGVSDAGAVVIQSFDADNNLLANYFVAPDGSVTAISYPNATRTIVHQVNTAGDVVGHYTDQQGLEHGFIYHSASSTYSAPIDAPTTGGTLLVGINDAGTIVGTTRSSPTTSIRLGLVATPNQ